MNGDGNTVNVDENGTTDVTGDNNTVNHGEGEGKVGRDHDRERQHGQQRRFGQQQRQHDDVAT